MTEQISTFFTIDMIFLWLNIGVIPFWFILMFFPNSKVCGAFVSSIFPIFTLSVIYLYLVYYFFITGYNFTQNFSYPKSIPPLLTCISGHQKSMFFAQNR